MWYDLFPFKLMSVLIHSDRWPICFCVVQYMLFSWSSLYPLWHTILDSRSIHWIFLQSYPVAFISGWNCITIYDQLLYSLLIYSVISMTTANCWRLQNVTKSTSAVSWLCRTLSKVKNCPLGKVASFFLTCSPCLRIWHHLGFSEWSCYTSSKWCI